MREIQKNGNRQRPMSRISGAGVDETVKTHETVTNTHDKKFTNPDYAINNSYDDMYIDITNINNSDSMSMNNTADTMNNTAENFAEIFFSKKSREIFLRNKFMSNNFNNCNADRSLQQDRSALTQNKNIVIDQNIDHSAQGLTACERGDLETAKSLAEKNLWDPITATDKKFGSTSLMWASSGGHLKIVEWLCEFCLEESTAVSLVGEEQRLFGKQLGTISTLLSVNQSRTAVLFKFLNGQNKEQRTACMFAAKYGHVEVLRYLLGVGVRVVSGNCSKSSKTQSSSSSSSKQQNSNSDILMLVANTDTLYSRNNDPEGDSFRGIFFFKKMSRKISNFHNGNVAGNAESPSLFGNQFSNAESPMLSTPRHYFQSSMTPSMINLFHCAHYFQSSMTPSMINLFHCAKDGSSLFDWCVYGGSIELMELVAAKSLYAERRKQFETALEEMERGVLRDLNPDLFAEIKVLLLDTPTRDAILRGGKEAINAIDRRIECAIRERNRNATSNQSTSSSRKKLQIRDRLYVDEKEVKLLHHVLHSQILDHLPVRPSLIHRKNKFDCSAAHWAGAGGRVEVMQWLYYKGELDVTQINDAGHGVVVKSAWKGHKELLEWLLLGVGDEVCDVNEVCNDGSNGEDSEPYIKSVAAKAVFSQVRKRDNAGQTPIDLARLAGHHEVADWMEGL
jgi:ankyrin repeat protein